MKTGNIILLLAQKNAIINSVFGMKWSEMDV